nr:HAD domain-containing protein [Microvirga tunisiensis]
MLDIDGVLVSGKAAAQSGDPKFLPPGSIALVNEILEQTGALIVVSSTWRRDSDCKDRLLRAGLLDRFHPVWQTPPFLDRSRMKRRYQRGCEIAVWQSLNQAQRYAILDDAPDILPEQRPFHVKTDYETGLGPSHVEQAIRILNA